jgi:hypothetical protein
MKFSINKAIFILFKKIYDSYLINLIDKKLRTPAKVTHNRYGISKYEAFLSIFHNNIINCNIESHINIKSKNANHKFSIPK